MTVFNVSGSTRSDFGPQLDKLNRDEFTVLAWDPPGYGYSFPPERHFTRQFFHNDAKYAMEFMHVRRLHKILE